MGHIFINTRLSHEEAEEIIRHEQNHLKQNHFLDIIFIEIVKSFQWFNPVVYLFNRSLRSIHEYQADQYCLRSGMPVVNYQSLILSQVFNSGVFHLTNSFSNPSLIKKRMIMMTKKRTSVLANVKILMVVPVTAIVFLVISAYREMPDTSAKQIAPGTIQGSSLLESNSELMPPPPPPPPSPISSNPSGDLQTSKAKSANGPDEVPYSSPEEMPSFPGGEAALMNYIGKNIRYPESAKEKNIQGKVIVRFCVTSEGGISMISVKKSVSPELDAEGMRVVSTLPAFKPGKQGGKVVPVWYMVPISFKLN
jgi:TonB family protein